MRWVLFVRYFVELIHMRVLKSVRHSFRSVSCDRSIASSSKANPPHIASWRFLVQFPVSTSFLKVIQWLLASSSSSSRPFCLSFNNVCWKAVPTQEGMKQLPFLLFIALFSFAALNPASFGQTDFHFSPAPHFKTFEVFLIYLPKCPSARTVYSYSPNLAFYWFLP